MLLILMFLGHSIGDFALQTDWVAANKGKIWSVNLGHAGVHTAAIFLLAKVGGFDLSGSEILLLLVSHFVIDAVKARWDMISIDTDQALHGAVMVLIWLFH